MRPRTMIIGLLALALLAALILLSSEALAPHHDARDGDTRPTADGVAHPTLRGTSSGTGPAATTRSEGSQPEPALWGTVTDEAGRPVPGAVVRCTVILEPGSIVYRDTPHVKVACDAEGRYEVRLEPGLYVVRAGRGDQESGRIEADVQRRTALDLRLVVPDARLVVRFRPVLPDIDVGALDVELTTSRGALERSSTPGEYVVERLVTGDIVSLSARLRSGDRALALLPTSQEDGWREYLVKDRRMHAHVRVLDQDVTVEFPVTRLPRLTGRLVDERGRPVPPAPYGLQFRTASPWKPDAEITFGPGEWTTYEVWILPGPPTAVFMLPVHVADDDYIGMHEPVLVPSLDHGEVREMNLVLERLRTCAVAGRVVDVAGAAPDRASVTIAQQVPVEFSSSPASAAFLWTRTVTTGPDGRFRLAGLLPVDSRVRIDGFAPRDNAVAPLPIEVASWPSAELDLGALGLVRPGSLAGTVRLAAGSPERSNVELSLSAVPLRPNGERIPLAWQARLDWKTGATFRIDGLPPGPYRLLVPGPNETAQPAAIAEAHVVSGETVQVEVVLPPR